MEGVDGVSGIQGKVSKSSCSGVASASATGEGSAPESKSSEEAFLLFCKIREDMIKAEPASRTGRVKPTGRAQDTEFVLALEVVFSLEFPNLTQVFYEFARQERDAVAFGFES